MPTDPRRRDERYARQVGLAGFGPEAQDRLAAAAVLVIGAGGLGTPALTSLAAMGVGRLTIVDDDRVAASNLHRQTAYTPADVGRAKAEVLAARLRAQNPDATVEARVERFAPANALALARAHDLVVDASDNLPTRYLANDACVLAGRPMVYGAAQGYEGQVATLNLDAAAPTYRCLYPEDPANAAIPDCAVGGVLGVVPGIIGGYQALEAVKVLAGVGEPLSGRLLLVDGRAGTHLTVAVAAVPGNRDPARLAALTPTRGGASAPEEVGAGELTGRLRAGELVVDVRTAAERAAAPLPGAAHVPLTELDAWLGVGAYAPTDRPLFVCASGKRSLVAAARFNAATGSRRGLSLRGGTTAYAALADATEAHDAGSASPRPTQVRGA